MTEEKKWTLKAPTMVVCERCGLLVGWMEKPAVHQPFYCIPCFDFVKVENDGKSNAEVAYAKLDDESLDAIMEVIGAPRLYNEGKSAMREWFLDRLRRFWNLEAKK